MKRLIPALSVALSCSIAFFSCAGSPAPVEQPSGENEAPAAEAPEIEPRFREETVWLPELLESYSSDGALSSVVRILRDDTGRALSEETLDSGGKVLSRKAWTYPADDRTEIESYDGAGRLQHRTVSIRKDSGTIEDVQYSPSGDVKSKELTLLDELGRKRSFTAETASGGSISTEYAYDGAVLKTIFVKDAAGQVLKRFERTYDSAGNVREEREFGLKDRLAAVIVFATENGRVVKETRQNASGSRLSSVSYAYDSEGNQIESTHRDRADRVKEVRKTAWRSFVRRVSIE